MLPLRIIDRDFNLLGEIDKYSSLQMGQSAYGIGTCELRINRYMQHADKLQMDNIFFPTNQTRKAYIIKHREIELDENGKATENWIIKAYQLKHIVTQRLIYPTHGQSHNAYSGSVEGALKHFVYTEMVNPQDPSRTYPNLVVAPNLNRGAAVNEQARYTPLADKLTELATTNEIAWNISIDTDNKQFVFDVYEGIERVAGQTDIPPVIFSTEFETLKSMSFAESAIDYKNVAIVAGQGEGIERKVIELGNAAGRDRYEIFVDARDVATETEDEEPQPRPEQDIVADLNKRGTEKLSEHAQTIFCEGQVLAHSILKYELDYFLADTVTLQNKDWGIELNTTLTAVNEVVEPNKYTIDVTFDKDRPTLPSKIKNEFKDIKRSLS